MGVYIYIRGEEFLIEPGMAQNIHIPEFNVLIRDSLLEEGISIWSNVNIYGATIGANTKIGAFVEIRKGVIIGKNAKIEPFVFIPEGVIIEDCVFIGPNVIFTNDLYPRACDENGKLIEDYHIVNTLVKKRASIGAGSCIRCGINIGEEAMIGMGSIVVDDVPPHAMVYGSKAVVKKIR